MRTLNNHRTVGLLSASALVLGLISISQPALAGISNTKHNLGSGTNPVAFRAQLDANGTAEICVFCHTPHGSNTTATAPLWNKLLSKTSANYTSYTSANSGTFDAIQHGPGSVSLGCLSCHDGTQAMDNILNAPGSGGASPNGGGVSGQSGASWTWNGMGGGAGISPEGFMSSSAFNAAFLGTNLSNDHPIGMNYCADPTTNGTGTCEADFTTISGTTTRRYIDTGGAGFQKTDMPLFTTGATTTKVECATCHDPHTENGLFLRMTGGNTGSQVCLACHTK